MGRVCVKGMCWGEYEKRHKEESNRMSEGGVLCVREMRREGR